MATQISPGPCPPAGCPPTTEIVCIATEKVYDSCTQTELEIELTTVSTGVGGEWPTGVFIVGQNVPCGLTPGSTITSAEISRVPVGGDYQMITLMVFVPITLDNPNDPAETAERVFTFTKTVTLYCPAGVITDTSGSSLIFCSSVVIQTDTNFVGVACVFQIQVVVECVAYVQLMVPSYGSCVPTPA